MGVETEAQQRTLRVQSQKGLWEGGGLKGAALTEAGRMGPRGSLVLVGQAVGEETSWVSTKRLP